MEINYSLSEIHNVAKQLLDYFKNKKTKIILFDAPMAAGKTTLIKEICKLLGVDEEVTSPTFAIINEYTTPDEPVYHFDFYRLKKIEDAINIGVEDYFYSGYYCFVEWADLIKDLLPENYAVVKIEITGDNSRKINLLT